FFELRVHLVPFNIRNDLLHVINNLWPNMAWNECFCTSECCGFRKIKELNKLVGHPICVAAVNGGLHPGLSLPTLLDVLVEPCERCIFRTHMNLPTCKPSRERCAYRSDNLNDFCNGHRCASPQPG